MILIIDNYDSFVYNILHFIELPLSAYYVVRNDQITTDDIGLMIERKSVDAIIISPGPMSPDDCGISNDVIHRFYKFVPILGVCLGHECIGKVFGCEIVQCKHIVHGESDTIYLAPSPLYRGLDKIIQGARYHSLCISERNFPYDDLFIDARLQDGTIMGVRHHKYPLFGVQYHPESIITGANGKVILKNFVELAEKYHEKRECHL